MSDFRFRALISVVFQPLCPACSLFLFRRINDDDHHHQFNTPSIGSNKRKIQIKYKIRNKQITMKKTEHANIPIKLRKLKKIY